MAALLEYECPKDMLACANLPVPEPAAQLDMIRTFHEIQDTMPLQGLDGLVWKLLYRERDDDLTNLLMQLQIMNSILQDITHLRTSL